MTATSKAGVLKPRHMYFRDLGLHPKGQWGASCLPACLPLPRISHVNYAEWQDVTDDIAANKTQGQINQSR